MTDTPRIQWFPGHMAKTRRLIIQNLKQVDAVVEIIDARIPKSSRNPELDKWVEGKPRIILLNKCDGADEQATALWINHFKEKGYYAIATDCRSGKGIKSFLPLVKNVLHDVLEKRKTKGMVGRSIRIMIVGIPNVGKSSFINRMAGSKRAKVEDRPGVTRGVQWVSLDSEVELLDMPGVLWPKFEDENVALRLAFTGAVKDDVMDIELLSMKFLEILSRDYPKLLEERYKISLEEIQSLDSYDLLCAVAKKRGMLLSGGNVNTERAAIMLLDEYRSGKLGKLTFEKPEEE